MAEGNFSLHGKMEKCHIQSVLHLCTSICTSSLLYLFRVKYVLSGHHGPLCGLRRNPFNSKFFLSIGQLHLSVTWVSCMGAIVQKGGRRVV